MKSDSCLSLWIKILFNFVALTSQFHWFVLLIVKSKLLAICLGQQVICLLIQRENSYPSPLPHQIVKQVFLCQHVNSIDCWMQPFCINPTRNTQSMQHQFSSGASSWSTKCITSNIGHTRAATNFIHQSTSLCDSSTRPHSSWRTNRHIVGVLLCHAINSRTLAPNIPRSTNSAHCSRIPSMFYASNTRGSSLSYCWSQHSMPQSLKLTSMQTAHAGTTATSASTIFGQQLTTGPYPSQHRHSFWRPTTIG